MDIFKDNTKTVPKNDPQIVRVDMEEEQIGGRKSHLPKGGKNDMTVEHVGGSGKK